MCKFNGNHTSDFSCYTFRIPCGSVFTAFSQRLRTGIPDKQDCIFKLVHIFFRFGLCLGKFHQIGQLEKGFQRPVIGILSE